MKTVDLPVGAHVAYNRNRSRDSIWLVEAFVMAHRPKGQKSSYYGLPTGNASTIGIAFESTYGEDKGTWTARWVQPSEIHLTWDEYTAAVARHEAEEARASEIRGKEQAERAARFDALPEGVRALLPGEIVTKPQTKMWVSIDLVEKLVEAAQKY